MPSRRCVLPVPLGPWSTSGDISPGRAAANSMAACAIRLPRPTTNVSSRGEWRGGRASGSRREGARSRVGDDDTGAACVATEASAGGCSTTASTSACGCQTTSASPPQTCLTAASTSDLNILRSQSCVRPSPIESVTRRLESADRATSTRGTSPNHTACRSAPICSRRASQIRWRRSSLGSPGKA